MDGRVRWFRGLARKGAGYSTPIMGTPWEVPVPRKTKESGMRTFVLRDASTADKFGANDFSIPAMLTTLRIKNLALVADLTHELQPGLNVITGETGADKSILIGALSL